MYRHNRLLDGALIALISFHLVLSPYTKVEESFNIQAIHDILKYGVFPIEAIDNYDHKQFPGVVPRTFIGSLVLAGFTQPFIWLSSKLGIELNGYDLQKLVRGLLGLINAWMLIRLRDSINKVTFRDRKSKTKGMIGFWYLVLLLSQFHLMYYSSRTLPNFIALPLVNFSLSKIIVGDVSGLTWLAFTGIVFRLEVGMFAVLIAIVSSVIFGQSSIFVNLVYLTMGTVIGGLSSVCIDSYFWGRLLVPEVDSFIFNIVNGKSAEWGVEPWGAYFRKYLFQLFRPPVVLMLALPGLVGDPADDGTKFGDKNAVPHPARYSLYILSISSVLFIAAMSFQPHKEWRFIIYTVPIFTLQAANGLTNIFQKWSMNFMNRLLGMIIVGTIAISAVMSLQMGYISSFNYPGGDALTFTNKYVLANYKDTPVAIHMDVPACMTGVTRFGELTNSLLVTYDKKEEDVDFNDYDIVITHNELRGWEELYVAKAFERISLDIFVQLLRAQKKDKTVILNIVKTILAELATGELTTLHSIIRSTVIIGDYLHVYKNLNINPKVVPEETQIVVAEELNPDEIREEVNEQIDEIESSILHD
ncbi:Dol-P-Man:Man(7)GlcNAc(2)-PP-Dol alpha-1,6-mannosyltransferase [Candida viswanathii]|uniref:Mannosyltransferase n=1 Tax=Candida viswanathii TaxID=5486 RepID=A0A367YKZ5_9ASCO|nr:Dol-P-Man:Man(7)GlcNAc(2)-PP-Dol alpha-1,6-mannosyltransferase [Candida viswanathii]